MTLREYFNSRLEEASDGSAAGKYIALQHLKYDEEYAKNDEEYLLHTGMPRDKVQFLDFNACHRLRDMSNDYRLMRLTFERMLYEKGREKAAVDDWMRCCRWLEQAAVNCWMELEDQHGEERVTVGLFSGIQDTNGTNERRHIVEVSRAFEELASRLVGRVNEVLECQELRNLLAAEIHAQITAGSALPSEMSAAYRDYEARTTVGESCEKMHIRFCDQMWHLIWSTCGSSSA
nr:unnamed protein product [Haemonchus contortus]